MNVWRSLKYKAESKKGPNRCVRNMHSQRKGKLTPKEIDVQKSLTEKWALDLSLKGIGK